MINKLGKILGLTFVLILTSPITIGVWMVNNKSLTETFGEIIKSNEEDLK